ncbi:unnamed protein product [Penicillium glandicola]
MVDTKRSILPKESSSSDGSAPMRKNLAVPMFNVPDKGSSEEASPDVGRVVSMQFFWDSHIHQDVPRGLFRSTGGDLDSDAEDEVDDATATLRIIDNLKSLLPLVFPTDDADPEPSVIFHDDVSGHNILVDDNGELTGLLDWECVSAVPIWKACDYPDFLDERLRLSKPDIENYKRKDGEEPDEMYFEHLWHYETTLLRDIFINEMRRWDAGWVEIFDTSQVKRDFDYAVQYCDSAVSTRNIEAWIGDMTAGISNPRSMDDRIWSF